MNRNLLLITLVAAALTTSCGVIHNTIEPTPEPQYPPVSREVMEMHRALMKMAERSTATAAIPHSSFRISWDYDPGAADTISGFTIHRSVGLEGLFEDFAIVPNYYDTTWVDTTVVEKVRYRYTLRAYGIGAEGDTTYSDVEIFTRLQPDNPPYYSDNPRDIMYTEPSDTVSGIWVAFGGLVNTRINVALYDSVYTTRDMFVFNIPHHHPYEIKWTIENRVEHATWRGLYDVTGNGFVDLSDLTFYGEQYNKLAYDSVTVNQE